MYQHYPNLFEQYTFSSTKIPRANWINRPGVDNDMENNVSNHIHSPSYIGNFTGMETERLEEEKGCYKDDLPPATANKREFQEFDCITNNNNGTLHGRKLIIEADDRKINNIYKFAKGSNATCYSKINPQVSHDSFSRVTYRKWPWPSCVTYPWISLDDEYTSLQCSYKSKSNNSASKNNLANDISSNAEKLFLSRMCNPS